MGWNALPAGGGHVERSEACPPPAGCPDCPGLLPATLKGLSMSKINPPSPTNAPSNAKRAPRLTAQRKLELYRLTRTPEAPIGELVRQAGVHLDDLRQIEQIVESAALASLKADDRHGRLPRDISPARVLQLEQELREKTTALAELSVAYTLLEKKERTLSPTLSRADGSRRRRAK